MGASFGGPNMRTELVEIDEENYSKCGLSEGQDCEKSDNTFEWHVKGQSLYSGVEFHYWLWI
jgi:hypothetical protein